MEKIYSVPGLSRTTRLSQRETAIFKCVSANLLDLNCCTAFREDAMVNITDLYFSFSEKKYLKAH